MSESEIRIGIVSGKRHVLISRSDDWAWVFVEDMERPITMPHRIYMSSTKPLPDFFEANNTYRSGATGRRVTIHHVVEVDGAKVAIASFKGSAGDLSILGKKNWLATDWIEV